MDAVLAGDAYRARWTAADGSQVAEHIWDPSGAGSYCYSAYISPPNLPLLQPMLGLWTVRVSRNGQPAFEVRFNLVDPSPPRPSISGSGVADPWTYVPGLSPGGWISIFGQFLSQVTQSWDPNPTVPLPKSLGGVRVRINGAEAVLSYVSPGVVNALVPGTLTPGEATVVVERDGVSSAPATAPLRRIHPAIYSIPVPGSEPPTFFITAALAGSNQLIGNRVRDPRVIRRARPGDRIDLYVLGLGRTQQDFPTDRHPVRAFPLDESIEVRIGEFTVSPEFAGLISPGLYLVRVSLPEDLPAGDVPVRIAGGELISRANVLLSVEQAPAPPRLEAVQVRPAAISGGQSAVGTIILANPTADSVVVSMSSSNPAVRVPATVRVAPGNSRSDFPVNSASVSEPQTATITAALGEIERSVTITLTPAALFANRTINVAGTATFEGRRVNLTVESRLDDIVPLAQVDNLQDFSSGVILYSFFGSPSVSGNSVTFSRVVNGSYTNIHSGATNQTITSGTVTLTGTSLAVGAQVTGTIRFSTPSRTLSSEFNGRIVSIR